jgi:hypothetical protein
MKGQLTVAKWKRMEERRWKPLGKAGVMSGHTATLSRFGLADFGTELS